MQLILRELREKNHLFQKEIASYLKITQQTYSRYETGELSPSLMTMESLAYFYDTSVDYLMGITDIEEPYKRRKKHQ